jgi:hypothetical protein
MSAKDRENELRELSQVIIEALTQNEDVMTHLADVKERNVIDSQTLLGLALKISDLLELSGMAFTQEEVQNSLATGSGETTPAMLPESGQKEKNSFEEIDGRKLTDNEIEFQEFSADKFDEKEWLQKTGLIW